MQDGKSRNNLNRNIQIRAPKDYPWQVLDNLVTDLGDCLTNDDISLIRSIIRRRDFPSYLMLSETWGPQSDYPTGMSATYVFARYQITALLKKFQFPSDSSIRRLSALRKFKEAEEKCATYNLTDYKQLITLDWGSPEIRVFSYARAFLQKLLGGTLPEFSKLTLWSRHGPGSNLDTKLGHVSLYDKYRNYPYSCTSEASSLARLCIEDDERWLGALESDYREKHGIEPWRILNREAFWASIFQIVPGNRITFVPKNALTDRSIAIEPCMNLYLQLGVDGYIRRRLKRWGVDLDSQEKNQELAGQGSRNWTSPQSFVTLDLASASDSISTRICEILLPPCWYTYLMSIRSPTGELDGEVISYEKISSMGNGFTFALESAIFTAIVYAVQREIDGSSQPEQYAVYGDDIIIPKHHADLVVRMLNLCGFSLNHEKSFIEGPFRESCGADWFNGTLVRPVFLTSFPTAVPHLFNDFNRLNRVLSLRLYGWEFEVTKLIRKWIPKELLLFGPYSDEDFDSYVHSPVPASRNRYGQWSFRRLIVSMRHLKGDNFLFRKLMHTLRPNTSESFSRPTWSGLKVTSAGSRFTITKPSSVVVSETVSSTSYWWNEYSEDFILKP